MADRKQDRRKALTKEAIKDGMLSLLRETPFENVTVSALCREAGIGRATFYTHYDGLTDVLDELSEDAISSTSSPNASNLSDIDFLAGIMRAAADPREAATPYMDLLPVCQRVADNPKYKVLFQDSFVAEYILMQIYRHEKPCYIEEMCRLYHVTPDQADKVFLFGIKGAFAVNKAMNWKKDDEWFHVQKVLLTFLSGGYEALRKL